MGNLMLVCGPELLGTLTTLGLVDEYRIIIKPTIQGRGKPMFGDMQQKQRLTLVGTRVFESGAVMHHYRTASFESR